MASNTEESASAQRRPPSVLVLDGYVRKALPIVRALGRAGFDVGVGADRWLAPAAYSRYTTERVWIPSTNCVSIYIDTVLSAIRSARYDAVIPLEEDSMAALLSYRTEVERYTKLAAPPSAAFAIATDKWQTLQLAEGLGIPIPQTAQPLSLEACKGIGKRFGYPLIIKPVSSSGSRGLRRVYDDDTLEIAYKEIRTRFGRVVVQEAIPWEGRGVGVGALFENGKERVSYSYKRLREFPVRGGPSTVRETTDDPQLRAYARKLLSAIAWDGVAMVEFKEDPRDGKAKLMEINPRFWGSIALASAAGINIPALLVGQLLGERVVQPSYRVGAICRWLLPGDVAHFLANPKRMEMSPSFFGFFQRGMTYDEFASDDVKGGVATILATLASVFDRDTWQKGVFRA